MSNRTDHYFRELVDEASLDQSFSDLENADRAFAIDPGLAAVDLDDDHGGIHSGLLPSVAAGLDVTIPGGVAFDASGRRIAVPSAPAVSVDLSKTGTTNVGEGGTPIGGVSTFPGAGLKRWVALFVQFDRELSEPRTDGTGATVFYRREESFRFFVSQGTAAATPTNFPPQQAGKIRLMDFRVTDAGTIDLTSTALRQIWLRAVTGGAPVTRAGTGFSIRGLESQDGIRSAIEQLLGYYNDHVNPAVSADPHPASSVPYTAGETWKDTTQLGGGIPATVQEAFDAVQTDLKSDDGSKKIGSPALVGVPDSFGAASVFDQLALLLSFVNDRLELSASLGIQTIADGIIVNAATTDSTAIEATGAGTGAGGQFTGGPSNGVGILGFGGGTDGDAAHLTAAGTGAALIAQASTGSGVHSDVTSGDAFVATATTGRGLDATVSAGSKAAVDANVVGAGTGIAVDASTVSGVNPAIRALSTSGGSSIATILAQNSGAGPSVYGDSSGGSGIGVRGDAADAADPGVYGFHSAATGIGVWGFSAGTTGVGVRGEATATFGVGVRGLGGDGGAGLFGLGSDGGFGVLGEGGGADGIGVLGLGPGASAPSPLAQEGVYGVGGTGDGTGVFGRAGGDGIGVHGFADGTGDGLRSTVTTGTGYGLRIGANTSRAHIRLTPIAGTPATVAAGDIWYDSGTGRFVATNAAGNSRLDVDSAPDVQYTPAVSANWAGADPTNVRDALDRIAAQLATATFAAGGPVGAP